MEFSQGRGRLGTTRWIERGQMRMTKVVDVVLAA
jgi:hypothetical protein